jgi:hypothetical protein
MLVSISADVAEKEFGFALNRQVTLRTHPLSEDCLAGRFALLALIQDHAQDAERSLAAITHLNSTY